MKLSIIVTLILSAIAAMLADENCDNRLGCGGIIFVYIIAIVVFLPLVYILLSKCGIV